MEAAVTLVLFLGLGYLLDRWLGTTPWFMVILVSLAGVGVFVIMKAKYMARMEQLEAQRREAAAAHRQPTTPSTPVAPAARSSRGAVASIGETKRALP